MQASIRTRFSKTFQFHHMEKKNSGIKAENVTKNGKVVSIRWRAFIIPWQETQFNVSCKPIRVPS